MIEVGEYVRTPYHTIEKITDIQLEENKIYDDMVFTDKSVYGLSWLKSHNAKHSKNIIDLIEVGDYVNGDKVFSIEKDAFIKGQIDIFFNRDEVNYWGDRSLSQITDKDIKSIVTKEQFANIEYRLEENK